MQWHVMKNSRDSSLLQSVDECTPRLQIFQQKVVHVRVMRPIFRNNRATYYSRLLKGSQPLVICSPYLEAAACDGIDFLHLGPKEGSQYFTWKIGRADIDPGVLIDLPTEELA